VIQFRPIGIVLGYLFQFILDAGNQPYKHNATRFV